MKLGVSLALVSADDTAWQLFGKLGCVVGASIGVMVAGELEYPKVQYVIMMSLVLGAFGGLGAALRQGLKEGKFYWNGIFVHVVNMGLVGLCCSLVALWWLAPVNDSKSYAIMGISGLMGLVGLPIIEPITEMVKQLMERVFGDANKRDVK